MFRGYNTKEEYFYELLTSFGFQSKVSSITVSPFSRTFAQALSASLGITNVKQIDPSNAAALLSGVSGLVGRTVYLCKIKLLTYCVNSSGALDMRVSVDADNIISNLEGSNSFSLKRRQGVGLSTVDTYFNSGDIADPVKGPCWDSFDETIFSYFSLIVNPGAAGSLNVGFYFQLVGWKITL